MMNAVALVKFFHFHIHCIRQLLAQIAEQLLAHYFRRQKTAGFIGNHVFGIHRHAFGQIAFQLRQQVGDAQPMLRAHHFAIGKIKRLAHFGDKRIQRGGIFGFAFVNFVNHQHHRRVFGQLFQHNAVGFGKAQRFHHKNNHVHAAHGFGYV